MITRSIIKATRKRALLMCLCFVWILSACKDAWKEEQAMIGEATQNLWQQIEQNQGLSHFADLLKQTHYDEVISASKTYTVWAPSNEALEHVSSEQMADSAWLHLFVGMHIAEQRHFAQQQTQAVSIKTMSGKMIHFDQQQVDQIAMTEKDMPATNGVLHIIPEALTPKGNIWELIMANIGEGPLQHDFIESLWMPTFNRSASTQIGVNEDGLPVYDSVFTSQNRYLNEVANLQNEENEYTYFILEDALFRQEQSKLSPYFVDTLEELSVSRTQWNVVKDLTVRGRMTADSLSKPVYSIRDSVQIQIHPADIIKQYEASNGMVYVLKRFDYVMATKIKPIIIEGEYPVEVRDGRSISRRTRVDPNGVVFQDLLIQNHGVNGLWVRYNPQVYAGTYNVYWRVIRDADLVLTPAAGQTDLVHFPMKVTWGDDPLTSPSTAGFGYVQEPVVNNGDGTFSPNYEEQLLGQLKVDLYGRISLYLVGNTVTTNGQNTLLLDYLRLEPIY